MPNDRLFQVYAATLSALIALIVGGCMGDLAMDGDTSASQNLYCYGDPDTAIVCTGEEEVWSCETMPNADKKCLHTPDGTQGWSCKLSGGKVVCEKDGRTGGGAGWSCSIANGVTTCSSLGGPGGFSPPGGSGWACTSNEFGVLCIGTPGGGPGGTGTLPPSGGGNKPPKKGDFRTQTPGGWGAPAAGNNPGAYRDKHFAAAFPGGLTIGCKGGKTARFTSARAIELFLPAGGTPGVLDSNLVDPLSTSAGVLAGQVTAMTLAAGFDAYDPSFGASNLNLVNLVAASGACKGMTAGQILAVANNVLGGCSSAMSPSAINGCVDAVNNNFVDGAKSGGYLVFP